MNQKPQQQQQQKQCLCKEKMRKKRHIKSKNLNFFSCILNIRLEQIIFKCKLYEMIFFCLPPFYFLYTSFTKDS